MPLKLLIAVVTGIGLLGIILASAIQPLQIETLDVVCLPTRTVDRPSMLHTVEEVEEFLRQSCQPTASKPPEIDEGSIIMVVFGNPQPHSGSVLSAVGLAIIDQVAYVEIIEYDPGYGCGMFPAAATPTIFLKVPRVEHYSLLFHAHDKPCL